MRGDSLRHTFRGTALITAADALAIPAGVAAVIYLTRRLGPELFGVFVLAYSIAIWVEFTVTSFFSRATIRAVSDAVDRAAVAGAMIRWHAVAGTVAGAVLWIASGRLAAFLNEPQVAPALRLFAIGVPIFALAQGYRNIQIGLGNFTRRAVAAATRILTRLVLLVVFVESGLSIEGAILSGIGASLVEWFVAARGVGAHLLTRWSPARELWNFGVPTFLFSVSARTIDRLDLWMLKWLGATAAAAGVYGAAQNAARIPMMLAASMAPLVLASVARLLRQGRDGEAREISSEAMRVVFLLVPFAAAGAGCAGALVELGFGGRYSQAGQYAAILLFAALAMLALFISTSVLTAYGRPGLSFAISGPLVLVAAAGCAVAIPRFGAAGAAVVTTATTMAGAAASLIVMSRLTGAPASMPTLVRGALLGAGVFVLVRVLDPDGWSVIVVLLIAWTATAAILIATGDLDRRELVHLLRVSPRGDAPVTSEE